jgi:hypothetical protein
VSVHNYLIDHDGFDWPSLLSAWSWLLPPEFTVWLVNRFGDLFIVPTDGTVLMLDIGACALTKLAESRDDFVRKIDEAGNADDWMMIPLVNRLTATGAILGTGECYSYKLPPILGGEYTVENTAILKLAEHYGAYGSIHEQLRDIPDGAQVVLKLRE